ncbi:MAG TPA: ATP-binding protein, partial [Armatimonadota bacterium]|nr:ATP-binding protein [Armatimonadota bacterium]
VAMENMRLYADVIDTHERLKEAQDQIVQNEKLSAVGRVVSGVAHELNNPLMAVIGYSELLADGAFGEETPKIAERVFTQAKRCASIVQGLLSFSRQEEIQVERTHINDIVYSAIEACEHARGDDLNLMRDLDAAIPEMAADPGALQQVMVNIINNAYQATNGHGGAVSVTSTLTDERVVVSVQDTGPGMPDDVLGRVFDPFYTTKGVGKGTGLGLSVSHGIIKEHGGELRAANAPEGGAVFTIDIPIVAPPDEAEVEPATTQDAPWLQ